MEALIQERRAELHRYRVWLRDFRSAGAVVSLGWQDLDREYRDEFRALSKIARQHRIATRVPAQGDHFVGVGR